MAPYAETEFGDASSVRHCAGSSGDRGGSDRNAGSAVGSGATGARGDFKSFINPDSLELVTAKCEPALADARPEERYQFERLGYFALDPDSAHDKQVWNRTITLRDTWAKEAKK